MEASVEVIIHFEEDSLSCQLTKKTTIEALKTIVCGRWSVLNPWSIRFVLQGECKKVYIDTDFFLLSAFERFYMRGVKKFSLFCERLICSPTPSPCPDPNPSSYTRFICSPSNKTPTKSLPKGCRVVSPVSKDLRAKKFFEGGSETVVKLRKNKLWAQAITGVGQIFYNGVQEVKNAVAMVCFENGHEPDNKKRKSEPSRYTVRCKNWKTAGCKWEFHAKSITSDNRIFEVMRYVKDHTCGAGYREKNVRVPAKFVQQVIADQVRTNPTVSPRKIMKDFQVEYQINLSYQQAYHGIKLVHKDIYGDDVKAYNDLVWYVKKVEETNDGSVVDFQYDANTKQFKRLFLAYGAVVKGFQYCRPMLYLDATFLTGRFKGTLMAATAKNGNQEFYVVAYAIVSHEDGANWEWFLKNLKLVVKDRQMVFLSDQGTGLLSAVPKVFPEAFHSYCYYHMKINLPVHGDDQLYPLVLDYWRHAVYALTEGGYNKAVKDLIDLGCGHVVRWMEKQGPEHWSNAFFEGCRYGEVASSCAESVNSWVKDEKRLPVSALVNIIRVKMMEMIAKRHKISETMTTRLTPEYEDKLKELTDEGNSWKVIPAGDTLFEVFADHRYAVDLESLHCSCNRWKVYGFPCSHAIQCIMLSGKQVYDFVQPYFTSSWYKTLYSFPIHPVPDAEKENESSNGVGIIPPPVKKNPGRPKTERFLPKSKKMKKEKRKITCGNCRRLSTHNSRTCPYPQVHDFTQI